MPQLALQHTRPVSHSCMPHGTLSDKELEPSHSLEQVSVYATQWSQQHLVPTSHTPDPQ
jgi:hypothetical protein